MAYSSRIVGHVACGAEKDARHVRKLGKRKNNQKRADQRKVHKEHFVDALGGDGCEMRKPHQVDLDLRNFRLVEITQAYAGGNYAKQEPERKIIVEQGNIAQFPATDPAQEKINQADKGEPSRPVKTWGANLHDSVNSLDPGDWGWHGLKKEAEMADNDHQNGIVENQREAPKPFGGIIN